MMMTNRREGTWEHSNIHRHDKIPQHSDRCVVSHRSSDGDMSGEPTGWNHNIDKDGSTPGESRLLPRNSSKSNRSSRSGCHWLEIYWDQGSVSFKCSSGGYDREGSVKPYHLPNNYFISKNTALNTIIEHNIRPLFRPNIPELAFTWQIKTVSICFVEIRFININILRVIGLNEYKNTKTWVASDSHNHSE